MCKDWMHKGNGMHYELCEVIVGTVILFMCFSTKLNFSMWQYYRVYRYKYTIA